MARANTKSRRALASGAPRRHKAGPFQLTAIVDSDWQEGACSGACRFVGRALVEAGPSSLVTLGLILPEATTESANEDSAVTVDEDSKWSRGYWRPMCLLKATSSHERQLGYTVHDLVDDRFTMLENFWEARAIFTSRVRHLVWPIPPRSSPTEDEPVSDLNCHITVDQIYSQPGQSPGSAPNPDFWSSYESVLLARLQIAAQTVISQLDTTLTSKRDDRKRFLTDDEQLDASTTADLDGKTLFKAQDANTEKGPDSPRLDLVAKAYVFENGAWNVLYADASDWFYETKPTVPDSSIWSFNFALTHLSATRVVRTRHRTLNILYAFLDGQELERSLKQKLISFLGWDNIAPMRIPNVRLAYAAATVTDAASSSGSPSQHKRGKFQNAASEAPARVKSPLGAKKARVTRAGAAVTGATQAQTVYHDDSESLEG